MVTDGVPAEQQQFEPIGARVKRLRIERGLAQDRLALESHVDQSGLSKFERGSRGVGEVPLRRIAQVLGLSFEELIAGTDFGARWLNQRKGVE
jgi:transcriptional regulator with XRE-family HTH domain